MKTTRKQSIAAIMIILVVCVSIQTAQGIHRNRWYARWTSLFDEAAQIQASIDKLEIDNSNSNQLAMKKKELSITMRKIHDSFQPDLIPKWLQIVCNLGTLLSLIALFAMWRLNEKKEHDQRVSGT